MVMYWVEYRRFRGRTWMCQCLSHSLEAAREVAASLAAIGLVTRIVECVE